MRALLAITSALSDENRVRTLSALHRRGELCVCQIVELLALAPSTVSKHLALLHSAGLVDARKAGRWMYYRLAEAANDTVRQATQLVIEATEKDPRALADDAKLRQILCCSPEELCKIQSARGKMGADSKCCSSAPATRAVARSPKPGRETSGRS